MHELDTTPAQDLADLDAALVDYNDQIDSVLVADPAIRQELALAAEFLDEPESLDEWLAEGNYTWRANYLDATPDRRHTIYNISGNARLMAMAWLTQGAVFTILILGMVL